MQTGFSQFLVNQNEFWGIYLESRLFAEFPVDYFLGEVRPLKVLVEVEKKTVIERRSKVKEVCMVWIQVWMLQQDLETVVLVIRKIQQRS